MSKAFKLIKQSLNEIEEGKHKATFVSQNGGTTMSKEDQDEAVKTKVKLATPEGSIDIPKEGWENTALKNSELGKQHPELRRLIESCIIKRWVLKLTQRELADKMGVNQSEIARFESFSVMPQLDTLLDVAKALDLNLVLRRKGDLRE